VVISNVLDMMSRDWDRIDQVDVYYVTRTYFTRHGAGPLPGEIGDLPYSKVVDETNIHNKFQGSLRFATLDLDILKAAINEDFAPALTANKKTEFKKHLVVTCADQVDHGMINFNHLDGQHGTYNIHNFATYLKKYIGGVESVFVSEGPTGGCISRQDVTTI
jgi:hypothetical protein